MNGSVRNTPAGEWTSNDVELLCQAALEETVTATLIGGGKHQVFKAVGPRRTYAVKVFSQGNGAVENTELAVYRLLSGSGHVKALFAASTATDGRQFAITEFVEGESLLTSYRRGDWSSNDMRRVAEFFSSYLADCACLDQRALLGPSTGIRPWPDTLRELINTIAGLASDAAPSDREALGELEATLRRYLTRNWDRLATVDQVVMPVDLNFDNFLATVDGRILAIDLDAFLVGDPKFALGELIAHVYGSDLAAQLLALPIFSKWSSDTDVFFYAAVSSYSVLTFCVRQGMEVTEVKPWENDATFLNLVERYQAIFDNTGTLEISDDW
ncbi:MAG: aminoglycoside phosphotransferase family protein [Propionibacteriaceae bacterium]|nr:aminoglycoside phosphotransferase family protein [Propionibacteriaceae bacterium]